MPQSEREEPIFSPAPPATGWADVPTPLYPTFDTPPTVFPSTSTGGRVEDPIDLTRAPTEPSQAAHVEEDILDGLRRNLAEIIVTPVASSPTGGINPLGAELPGKLATPQAWHTEPLLVSPAVPSGGTSTPLTPTKRARGSREVANLLDVSADWRPADPNSRRRRTAQAANFEEVCTAPSGDGAFFTIGTGGHEDWDNFMLDLYDAREEYGEFDSPESLDVVATAQNSATPSVDGEQHDVVPNPEPSPVLAVEPKSSPDASPASTSESGRDVTVTKPKRKRGGKSARNKRKGGNTANKAIGGSTPLKDCWPEVHKDLHATNDPAAFSKLQESGQYKRTPDEQLLHSQYFNRVATLVSLKQETPETSLQLLLEVCNQLLHIT